MKIYTNTESLNCKQVIKCQQNRSTSATATASLVRSLKSISVHYRYRRDWLSSVRPCEWQDLSTPSLCSKCSPCARSQTQARRRGRRCLTALSMTTWWKCSHSSTRRDLSWSTSQIWLRYTRSCSFHQNLVVDWVKVSTVGWPQSWNDEVWCLMSKQMHCLTCSVGWTPECLTIKYVGLTLYWKLKYFVVIIWILITRVINNIFLWNLALLSQIYS